MFNSFTKFCSKDIRQFLSYHLKPYRMKRKFAPRYNRIAWKYLAKTTWFAVAPIHALIIENRPYIYGQIGIIRRIKWLNGNVWVMCCRCCRCCIIGIYWNYSYIGKLRPISPIVGIDECYRAVSEKPDTELLLLCVLCVCFLPCCLPIY